MSLLKEKENDPQIPQSKTPPLFYSTQEERDEYERQLLQKECPVKRPSYLSPTDLRQMKHPKLQSQIHYQSKISNSNQEKDWKIISLAHNSKKGQHKTVYAKFLTQEQRNTFLLGEEHVIVQCTACEDKGYQFFLNIQGSSKRINSIVMSQQAALMLGKQPQKIQISQNSPSPSPKRTYKSTLITQYIPQLKKTMQISQQILDQEEQNLSKQKDNLDNIDPELKPLIYLDEDGTRRDVWSNLIASTFINNQRKQLVPNKPSLQIDECLKVKTVISIGQIIKFILDQYHPNLPIQQHQVTTQQSLKDEQIVFSKLKVNNTYWQEQRLERKKKVLTQLSTVLIKQPSGIDPCFLDAAVIQETIIRIQALEQLFADISLLRLLGMNDETARNVANGDPFPVNFVNQNLAFISFLSRQMIRALFDQNILRLINQCYHGATILEIPYPLPIYLLPPSDFSYYLPDSEMLKVRQCQKLCLLRMSHPSIIYEDYSIQSADTVELQKQRRQFIKKCADTNTNPPFTWAQIGIKPEFLFPIGVDPNDSLEQREAKAKENQTGLFDMNCFFERQKLQNRLSADQNKKYQQKVNFQPNKQQDQKNQNQQKQQIIDPFLQQYILPSRENFDVTSSIHRKQILINIHGFEDSLGQFLINSSLQPNEIEAFNNEQSMKLEYKPPTSQLAFTLL